MKINDITALDYVVSDSTVVCVFKSASSEELEGLDLANLVVTTDVGDIVEIISGFTERVSLLREYVPEATFTLTVKRPAPDLNAEIEILTTEKVELVERVETLEAEGARLQVQAEASQSRTMTLEEYLGDILLGFRAAPKPGDAWDMTMPYVARMPVTQDGTFYRAKAGNQGSSPRVNPQWWDAVEPAEWNYVLYRPGDLVYQAEDPKTIYMALQTNSGGRPGSNPDKWRVVSTGELSAKREQLKRD